MAQLLIAVAFTLLLAGCATAQEAVASRSGEPDIELLGFSSCPNTPVMHDRLRAAMVRLNLETEIVVVDQESLGDDDVRRKFAAPTVLLDGRDLFDMDRPPAGGMGCRIYEGPGGMPSVDTLTRRLSSTFSGEVEQ